MFWVPIWAFSMSLFLLSSLVMLLKSVLSSLMSDDNRFLLYPIPSWNIGSLWMPEPKYTLHEIVKKGQLCWNRIRCSLLFVYSRNQWIIINRWRLDNSNLKMFYNQFGCVWKTLGSMCNPCFLIFPIQHIVTFQFAALECVNEWLESFKPQAKHVLYRNKIWVITYSSNDYFTDLSLRFFLFFFYVLLNHLLIN